MVTDLLVGKVIYLEGSTEWLTRQLCNIHDLSCIYRP